MIIYNIYWTPHTCQALGYVLEKKLNQDRNDIKSLSWIILWIIRGTTEKTKLCNREWGGGGTGEVVPWGIIINFPSGCSKQYSTELLQGISVSEDMGQRRCRTGQRLGREWSWWNELWAWVRHPLGNARGWGPAFLVKA